MLDRMTASVTIHYYCMGGGKKDALKVNGDWGCQSLTFCLTSPCVFHRRKSVIQDLKDIMLNTKWQNFHLAVSFF